MPPVSRQGDTVSPSFNVPHRASAGRPVHPWRHAAQRRPPTTVPKGPRRGGLMALQALFALVTPLTSCLRVLRDDATASSVNAAGEDFTMAGPDGSSDTDDSAFDW